MKITKLLTINILILTIFILSGCNILKPDWSKTAEPNAMKRARQNVEEGRGMTGGGLLGKTRGTDFVFASSNPLWRASLDTLDFMVLSNVDYAGGLIISDWYSENNPNESIKITIRFLASEVRVDALNVIVHKKNCQNQNCLIKEIETDLSFDIKDKILKKAALYVKADKEIITEKNKGKIKMSERDRY
jgi:hypothetical protein